MRSIKLELKAIMNLIILQSLDKEGEYKQTTN